MALWSSVLDTVTWSHLWKPLLESQRRLNYFWSVSSNFLKLWTIAKTAVFKFNSLKIIVNYDNIRIFSFRREGIDIGWRAMLPVWFAIEEMEDPIDISMKKLLIFQWNYLNFFYTRYILYDLMNSKETKCFA